MKKYRFFLSVLILLVTIAVFVRYLQSHPEVLQQLAGMNWVYIVLIGLLYLGIIVILSFVNSISVRLSGKKIGRQESFNLTATSSIANFFGPLQSGVGIRALYLKTKLQIPVKQYILASLYYYGMYAFFSGIFLLFGNATYRLPLLILTCVGGGGVVYYIRYRTAKYKAVQKNVSLGLLGKLAGAVLLQLVFITTIYFIELAALGKTASLAQVVSYSGAANFSLFVAITPGAIGIREAFLVFSERLHHIDSATVVAANIIDRSVYVGFLGLLFCWLVATHTRVQIKAHRQAKEV